MTENFVTLGIDLDLTSGDLAFGPDGDLAFVAGSALVQQKMYLACIDLLLAVLQVPFTPQTQSRLEQQCQARMQALPEVQSVGSVTSSLETTTLPVVTLQALVTLAGGLTVPVTVRAAAPGQPPVITTGIIS